MCSHALKPGPLGLFCPGCGRQHPVVDGIPMVLRDLDSWLQSEAPTVLRRRDLDHRLDAFLARGAGGVLRRDQQRMDIYANSPKSDLHTWLSQVLADLDGELLELGCGIGAHDDARVLGIDLHWSSLLRFPGQAILADALDPPFGGSTFDAVLAINLLDSCRDPFLLLQQADALLRPGGTLVLSSPFHWQHEITPARTWLSPQQVQQFLLARGYHCQGAECDWILRADARTTTVHRCVTWIARREDSLLRR